MYSWLLMRYTPPQVSAWAAFFSLVAMMCLLASQRPLHNWPSLVGLARRARVSCGRVFVAAARKIALRPETIDTAVLCQAAERAFLFSGERERKSREGGRFGLCGRLCVPKQEGDEPGMARGAALRATHLEPWRAGAGPVDCCRMRGGRREAESPRRQGSTGDDRCCRGQVGVVDCCRQAAGRSRSSLATVPSQRVGQGLPWRAGASWGRCWARARGGQAGGLSSASARGGGAWHPTMPRHRRGHGRPLLRGRGRREARRRRQQ